MRTKNNPMQHINYLKRTLYILFLILGNLSLVQAQTYPVQTNVYMVPPYGKHLNDYYTTSKEKLVVSLLNRDQLKPSLEVRLRMTVSASNGLKLQTKEEVNYPTIILDAGIPTRLTQDDLAPYFLNLNSQGYFEQGKLPDGLVEFTFQAIEKYTGKALSAPATGRVWLTSQRPPFLRLPSNNEDIAFRDPFNLKFQWEPQHKNISQVEYEFELRELPNDGAVAESAFLYSPVIYRDRLIYTSLIYDVMMPPLDPNRLYGWRVRAIAKDGVDELNMFENNGFSEIYGFRTQNNCMAPGGCVALLQGRRLDLTWLPSPGHNEFVVQYRLKFATGSQWQSVNTFEPQASLYDLQRGAAYEFRVGGICTVGQAIFAPMGEITVPAVDSARLANCGVMPSIDLENKEPLQELRAGDVVMLSDYPMTVIRAMNQGGTFSGEGWVPVNWLLDTKWEVAFTNISINTDYRMTKGSVRARYDETESQIADVDEITEGGVANTRQGITRADVALDFSIPENPEFEYNAESGELIVYDTWGQARTVDLPKNNQGQAVFPITVKDKDGKLYKVDESPTDEQGKQAGTTKLESTYLGKQGEALSAGSFDTKNITSSKAIVSFDKGAGIYAFDQWIDPYAKINKIADKYEHLASVKEPYHVAWKLLPEGTTDQVQASLTMVDTITAGNVQFTTPQGLSFQSRYNEKTRSYTLNLVAGAVGDVQEVYALYKLSNDKYLTLGKLNVITCRKQNHKLIIVQVNDNKLDKESLAAELDKVYKPVGVSWNVEEDDFSFAETEGFFEKGSKLLSAYNDKMKALNKAYADQKGVDSNTTYAFILGEPGDDGKNRDTQGFMPRGSQFAYIFKNKIAAKDLNAVIAHELGHGKWKLSHTFDPTYGEVLKKGSTDNLMDYSNKSHLAKWQWDQISDPAWFANPLDSDDKGMIGTQTRQDGILVKESTLYAMTGGFVIELANVTILPSCHFENKNLLYSFKDSQGKIWVANIYIDQMNPIISSYRNEKNVDEIYPNKGRWLKNNEQVFKINYDSITSKLILKKVTFGTVDSNVRGSTYSDIFINANSYANTKIQKEEAYAESIVNNPCLDNSDEDRLDDILTDLRRLKDTSKPNQSFELESWNPTKKKLEYYTLKDDKLVEVQNPLTNEAILNGNWSDKSETKIRYTRIGGGVIQVKAVGIKQGIQLKGKELNSRHLSEHLTAQTNKYLADNNVTSFASKPKSVATTEDFADGGRITIGGNGASFTEIISSGVDFTGNLLKTGEVEEKTYLTSTQKEEVIHAPGLVTGSFEVVAQKVTDITSLGCLAYDLAVDQTVRAEMYKQFKGIKDEVAADPSSFLPVLGEVFLTVGTGNTVEQTQSIFDEKTDFGKRSHLVTRGTGNAIFTAMSGAALVKNLPEIGDKLTEWVKKINKSRGNIRKVLSTDAGKAYLKKYFDKYVNAGSFEEWFSEVNKFRKGELNFEVHHIIPVKVLENNPELQRILRKFNFDFNDIDNAIPLQKKSLKLDVNGHANHPDYDRFMDIEIKKITRKEDLTDLDKFELIQKRINDIKNKLETDVLLGNKDVNNILN